MKRKQRQKRLFVALVAALLLLVTVPLMAAFAGEGDDAVSGSDIESASDNRTAAKIVSAVSNSDNAVNYIEIRGRAEPKNTEYSYDDPSRFDDPEFWYDQLMFNSNGRYYSNWAEGCEYAGYDAESNSLKFVAPPCSNPLNTFLHWKDNQNGKIYTPGQTYSISIDEMKRRCLHSDGTIEGWFINSVWEGDQLGFNQDATIQFDIPTDSDDPLQDDGFNKYDCWEGKHLHTAVSGIYDLRTEKTSFTGDHFITIPTDYVPTFKEYTFSGWNTQSDGNGTSYHPGDKVTFSEDNFDDWIILFAIFDGYTVKNHSQMSWYDWATDDYQSYDFVCDENGIVSEIKMPAALTNATARFGGWRNYYNDTIYEANAVIRNFDLKEAAWYDGNNRYYFSLEAVWEGDTTTFNRPAQISLEFNGGWNSYTANVSGVKNNNTGELTFNGDPTITIPVSANPDNNDGFEFIGWNTSEYGNGTMYQPGVPIHIKDTEGLNQYLYLDLYATFQTDSEFTVVAENGNISNFIEKVQPSAGLVLVDDVSIDEVKMVIANLEDDVKEDVIEAISQQVDITTEGEDANCQMLDISLVDSQDRGVSIQEGKILIIVSYPDIPNAKDYNYTIYHYKDGVAEPIHVEKLENGLAFYADSFSPYALVWTAEEPEEPGDDNNNSSEETQNTKDYIAIDSDSNQYTLDEIKLNITALSGTEGKEYIVLTGEKEENAQAFNITLTTQDGIPVDLLKGKTLTVELNRPAISGNFSFKVYHIVDGKAVPVKLSPNTGSKIVFEASGFSPYVLSWHETISAGTDSPATGDDFTPVPYIILILLSLSAVAVTFYLNRTKIWKFIKA